MLCFAQNEGNVLQWLWLEVITFWASVVTLFVMLVGGFAKAPVHMMPKQHNIIVCQDMSKVDKSKIQG